jgi:hypothetical protein
MAWTTPKTDWAPDDAVSDTDFNRIEGDIAYLKPLILTGTFPAAASYDYNDGGLIAARGITKDNFVAINGSYLRQHPNDDAWRQFSYLVDPIYEVSARFITGDHGGTANSISFANIGTQVQGADFRLIIWYSAS